MAKTAEQKKVLTAEKSFDERFPIVRASTLSLKDSFLKHKPQTNQQKRLMASITAGIKAGLKDFRRPAIDPSFDNDGNIIYKEGERPAVGKSPKYWISEAKKFMPEKNSRMGSRLQYDAFLCLLIKYLIEEKGYKVADAWEAVCDNSRGLGHYRNSKNAKGEFEPTGSRKVWEFCDLANTCKIVTDENSAFGFSLVGGGYGDGSIFFRWRMLTLSIILMTSTPMAWSGLCLMCNTDHCTALTLRRFLIWSLRITLIRKRNS